jgi:hypothetical protein
MIQGDIAEIQEFPGFILPTSGITAHSSPDVAVAAYHHGLVATIV